MDGRRPVRKHAEARERWPAGFCVCRSRRMTKKEDQTVSAGVVVLQGVVKPDGTLEVEGKVPLPAGKVQVTLQSASDQGQG